MIVFDDTDAGQDSLDDMLLKISELDALAYAMSTFNMLKPLDE